MSSPADAGADLAKRPDVRTIYLLKRAETAVKAALEGALSDLGVTPGQYTALTLLKTRREASSADLARQAGVTPQSISETMAVLDQRGWIGRTESPTNRRIQRIGLTPAGEDLLRVCEVRVDRMERVLTQALSATALEGLREALASIVHAGGEAGREAHATPRNGRPGVRAVGAPAPKP